MLLLAKSHFRPSLTCLHSSWHDHSDIFGEGEITAAELGSVMESLGLKPSKTELQDIMNEIDVDQSGTISFEGASNAEIH